MSAISTFRAMCLVALAVAPLRVKLFVYRRLFGWSIGPGVSIGICVITAKRVRIGRAVRIGNFTVMRNLPNLALDDHVVIGAWNWITSGEFFTSGEATIPPPKSQGFFMGRHAALTSRHYVDCPGGVTIGAFTTVAGVRSTLLTHYVDTDTNMQRSEPIRIGDYCYIGSNVKFTPGASVPDGCIVGMGAVVAGALTEPNMLYVGVPAKPVRPVGDGEYFRRKVGGAQ